MFQKQYRGELDSNRYPSILKAEKNRPNKK